MKTPPRQVTPWLTFPTSPAKPLGSWSDYSLGSQLGSFWTLAYFLPCTRENNNQCLLRAEKSSWITWFSSVQFSHSVVSDSLRPHELLHTRPTSPSPTPGVHTNSRPSSRWCHPVISSSAVPFSSWPQYLPTSESFSVGQLFTWGGQSTGVSALASFLPKKTQDWSPLE